MFNDSQGGTVHCRSSAVLLLTHKSALVETDHLRGLAKCTSTLAAFAEFTPCCHPTLWRRNLSQILWGMQGGGRLSSPLSCLTAQDLALLKEKAAEPRWCMCQGFQDPFRDKVYPPSWASAREQR